jgi:hypothetical protein
MRDTTPLYPQRVVLLVSGGCRGNCTIPKSAPLAQARRLTTRTGVAR